MNSTRRSNRPSSPFSWRFMTLLAVFGLIVGQVNILSANPVGPPKRPNILFVLIDDMGWPDVSCYGHSFHETPVIDSLARQGVKFTNFYAATPVCSSTRSTIQCGQYSGRTHITDFIPGHWRPFEKLTVPPIEHNLASGIQTPGDLLKAAGYRTAYFGKWHLGSGAKYAPDKHGYQVTQASLGKEFRQWRAQQQGRQQTGSSKSNPGAGPKSIDLLTDATIWFMEQSKEQPFFATLSHHAVHIPLQATDESIAKYRKKPKPQSGVNNPLYAAMTEDLDRSIGRLLKTLDRLQIADNTIVVFTSDNGGLRMIYTGVGEVVSTNAPLRDEKGTLYEGGIRVPFIVRWPGVISEGTVSDELATTADLLPTFCAMAGAKLPTQPLDGMNLTHALKNPAAKLDRDAIYFHYPHYHHSRPAGAIRQGDWKLIEFFEDGKLELYNLRADVGESRNLADQQMERAKRMQQKLAQWRSRVGARMPTDNPKHDAAKASQWWSRRTNKPLDIEALRKRYQSRKTGKP